MPDPAHIAAPPQTSFLDRSSRWQRVVLAFTSGVLACLALPPAGLWPTLFIAFPALVLLLDTINRQAIFQTNSPARKFWAAFACGWWFGFGYFIVSLYWIGASFLVEADKFAVFLPLAVVALPAGLAIFWGLASGISILLWKPDFNRLLILAAALTSAEWLRGHIFTGFPWNTIGYASASMAGVEQLAAFTGLYGVSFFVLICAFAPVTVFSRSAQRSDYILSGILLASLLGVWFAGYQRTLSDTNSASATAPIIRVVQPNIDQKKKWVRASQQENIDKYFQMSLAGPENNMGGLKGVDIVVWPESALPALYEENPQLQTRVANLLPENTLLLMGALRRERRSVDGGKHRFFNSILAVDSDGRINAVYNKFHLVPFGEYLPGEKWLAPLGLRKIVAIPSSFNTGPGPQTLKVSRFPAFSPMICYEIIFPSQIVDQNNRPDWIVNVTNDGWFGKTAGPHQHLTQARFRAIEQGLPIVRAANTGISAAISPYGKVIKSLPLGKAGVFDIKLPKPLPKTIYARYGDYIALFLILGMLNILMFCYHLLTNMQKPEKST